MRSNITGTTHNPVAWWRSTSASVASGSNLRRVTTVHAIAEANTSCEKPQAWNIGATTTVVSPSRHGVRRRIATRLPAPPPECLAPLGVPVVPEVSRISRLLRSDLVARCPAWEAISFSTVGAAGPATSDVGAAVPLSTQARIRRASGLVGQRPVDGGR